MTVLTFIGSKKWLAASALAAGLAFGQLALAEDCDGFCPRKQAMMVEKLNLNDDQAAKFKEIMKGSYDDMQKLHDDFHNSKAFKKHLEKMDKQQEATDEKLAKVLSPEQMEQLKQMPMHRGWMGEGYHHGMKDGYHHGMKDGGYHHGMKDCPEGKRMYDGKGPHRGEMMNKQ